MKKVENDDFQKIGFVGVRGCWFFTLKGAWSLDWTQLDPPSSPTLLEMSCPNSSQPRSKKPRSLPKCPCVEGCTLCISRITQPMNLIIYILSHLWELEKRSRLALLPRVGEKMLLRYHDQDILCRVMQIPAENPQQGATALYTVRWPPDEKDLQPGEKMAARRSIPRKSLRFRSCRFPRSWAVWLVKHLHLVEGGTAEVAFRRRLMKKKIAFAVWNRKKSNNCKLNFIPSSWS